MACCKALNAPESLTCQVCLDSFQNPIQLFLCSHIFCQECVKGAKTCPTCYNKIDYTKPPGDSIMQTVQVIPVMCTSCGWQGTRGQSLTHRCGIKETHSNYSTYPQLSDEELYARAISSSPGSIFSQPGSIQGISLVNSSSNPTNIPASGVHIKRQ